VLEGEVHEKVGGLLGLILLLRDLFVRDRPTGQIDLPLVTDALDDDPSVDGVEPFEVEHVDEDGIGGAKVDIGRRVEKSPRDAALLRGAEVAGVALLRGAQRGGELRVERFRPRISELEHAPGHVGMGVALEIERDDLLEALDAQLARDPAALGIVDAPAADVAAETNGHGGHSSQKRQRGNPRRAPVGASWRVVPPLPPGRRQLRRTNRLAGSRPAHAAAPISPFAAGESRRLRRVRPRPRRRGRRCGRP